MRKVYFGFAALLLLAVVVQFYFAGVGAFAKPQDDNSFALHAKNAMIIAAVSLLATIVAAIARAPGRMIAMTALPLGLVIVQILLFIITGALTDTTDDKSTPGGLAILGLHAINGLLILGASSQVFAGARRFAFAPRPVAAVPDSAATAA